ncbi:hypothetical protein [Bacillus sp. B-jedd]|uniref:hypothetical protein n=1 Tax=Bacillus sp. B-jedd TaxID=1476857 RepID=UPI0005156AB0|nr:hypothetical protein [Bacillus sp. B-jedd]CEG26274.1 hypothetical protein BN1002_01116 [Bacillus sp. B-jedd]
MILQKQKWLFFTSLILLFLSIAGCKEQEKVEQVKGTVFEPVQLEGKTIQKATVAMVGESMLDVKEPHVTYGQEDVDALKTFVNSIEQAEKVNGFVDVTAPDYMLTITFTDETIAKYMLWLGVNGGSLMNENNTHTIYSLPSRFISDLNKYVK